MAKLEDLFSEWEVDSKYNREELGEESLNCSYLHEKYLKLYFKERSVLLATQKEYSRMKRLRWEYWAGKLDAYTLREYGWDPQPLTILKSDIQMYLDSDDVLTRLELKSSIQNEKVEYLSHIIKHISNRGFNIKNAIEYERFRAGQ